MKQLKVGVAALALAFAAACGAVTKPCAATCLGCCSATDQCITVTTAARCGTNGNACVACEAGAVCTFGACQSDGGAP